MRKFDLVACVDMKDVCGVGVCHVVAAAADGFGFVHILGGKVVVVFGSEAWLFEPGVVVRTGFIADVAGGLLPDAVVGEANEGDLKSVRERLIWENSGNLQWP